MKTDQKTFDLKDPAADTPTDTPLVDFSGPIIDRTNFNSLDFSAPIISLVKGLDLSGAYIRGKGIDLSGTNAVNIKKDPTTTTTTTNHKSIREEWLHDLLKAKIIQRETQARKIQQQIRKSHRYLTLTFFVIILALICYNHQL